MQSEPGNPVALSTLAVTLGDDYTMSSLTIRGLGIDGLDWPKLRELAVEAGCDPRTIIAELHAQRGRRPPVRGGAGRRIRAVLAYHGLVVPSGDAQR